MIALAVLLIAAAAPAVSANLDVTGEGTEDSPYYAEINETSYTSHEYALSGLNSIDEEVELSRLYFKHIEFFEGATWFRMNVQNPDYARYDIETDEPIPITLGPDGINGIGTLYILAGDQALDIILVIPDGLKTGGYTGSNLITINRPPGYNFYLGGEYYPYSFSAAGSGDASYHWGFADTNGFYNTDTNPGTYEAIIASKFRHQIYAYNTTGVKHLRIIKNVDSYAYSSTHVIDYPGYSAIEETNNLNVTWDMGISPLAEPALNVSIFDDITTGNWYNYTFWAVAAPEIDGTTVSVSVRSLQTGALIPGAELTILDSQTSETVVDETLPSGTNTFSLEKATTLRYHASATAEDYTLISPILFGATEDTMNIVLWMSPDASPDDPVEPDKSMLYGYVLTQGNQQPISGATVTLDGVSSTTTSSTGFYIFNNVTPATYSITATATNHDSVTESVTLEANTTTQHNLALTGNHSLKVIVKDGDTLVNIPNATISLSDGQESTQNPVTFDVDYGVYTITTAASGYYSTTQSAYVDVPGTTTATVLMTAIPPEPTPAEQPNYSPHSVRFLCVNDFNTPLQNVTIRAVYQESSSPVDWLWTWLGISEDVQITETTLEGVTGIDGSVTFLMVDVIQYRITVTAPDLNMTKTFDIYPKEEQITIRFQTVATPGVRPAYDLTATETSPDTIRLAFQYHDTTNATTSLAFTVANATSGETVYQKNFATFPGWANVTYDVNNEKGTSYRFGFQAQNTEFGPISAYKEITLKGDGLLVDLGFEDRSWYQWIAIALIFLFAGAFSGSNVRQGAVLVPIFGGGLFWLIGWLPAAMAAPISAIGFLGVLLYMRKGEWRIRQ